jgi:hypothetical protein
VFDLKRLPLPQDRRLRLLEGLMGARQHPRKGNRCRFWLGAGPEPPPKNHLRLLQSGRQDGAGRAPSSTSMAGSGANGASSAATDCVFNGIAVIEAVAPAGAVGTPSSAAAPLGVGAAAAGPPAGA